MTFAGQVMERGVAVEDLEDKEMDGLGGIEQSVLPGVVLLATGVVDGVFVEQRCDVLSNAAKDANKSVMQLHRRVLQRSPRWYDPSTCTKEDPLPFCVSQLLRPLDVASQVNDIRDGDRNGDGGPKRGRS